MVTVMTIGIGKWRMMTSFGGESWKVTLQKQMLWIVRKGTPIVSLI